MEEAEQPFALFRKPARISTAGNRLLGRDGAGAEMGKEPPSGTDRQTGMDGFAALGLDQWILATLSSLSMGRPTAVQAACIPRLLGRPASPPSDVVGVAETGSGKTAAFVLPILHHLNREPWSPFALILAPTRELAVQIDEQVRLLGRGGGVRTVMCIGGMDMLEQVLALQRSPHFIIATPGRLLDILESEGDGGREHHGRLRLERLRFVILDEADRLLDSRAAFGSELKGILGRIFSKGNRPVVGLFTATLSQDVLSFGHLSKDVFIFSDQPKGADGFSSCSTVSHKYLLIPSKAKDCHLYYVLSSGALAAASVVVFVGKCVTAELLTLSLRCLKVAGGIVSLHSRQPQRQRLSNLAHFRNGSARILVATDVASRGLDIPSVHAVVNYDLPADPRDYVHRTGRAGRAGRSGIALSFVSELDIDIVKAIEETALGGSQMDEYWQDAVAEEERALESLNRCSDARQWASQCIQEGGRFRTKIRQKRIKD